MNNLEEELDKILSQAFTDGASDTMWQNDRHIEIFATAKARLTALIQAERVEELQNLPRTQKDSGYIFVAEQDVDDRIKALEGEKIQ